MNHNNHTSAGFHCAVDGVDAVSVSSDLTVGAQSGGTIDAGVNIQFGEQRSMPATRWRGI
jgi:hypothetical protein